MLTVKEEILSLSRRQRLGGLKRIIPASLVQEILRSSPGGTRPCRRLPKVFMVWFVLAMGLFCRDCYCQVYRWLKPYGPEGTPGRSSLCEARRRLGVGVLVALARRVVRLLALPGMPGSTHHGLRLMSIDGFVINTPDTPDNERVFGRPRNGRSKGAFPQVRVLALFETATHVLARWLIKPIRTPEQSMANYVLKFLEPGTLLLWDCAFLSYDRVRQVQERACQFLGRVSSSPTLTPTEHLCDGSCLAKLYRSAYDRQHGRRGILVRVIRYTLNDPGRPGSGKVRRLLTTLLDPELDPAPTLVELYHCRWEEELGIDEVKTHQLARPTLRSQTPAGVVQELYALFIGHFILRFLMAEAAARAGVGPLRISFQGTLNILHCRVSELPSGPSAYQRWWDRLIAEISREQIPARRNRVNPRAIKRKISKWDKKRPKHDHFPQPSMKFLESVAILS